MLLELPFEIIGKSILSRLSVMDIFHVRAVSIRGKAIFEEYCRTILHLDLSAVARIFTPCALNLLVGPGCVLRSVRLRGSTWLDDSSLQVILSSSPNITHLDVASCPRLSQGSLFFINEHCLHAETLILEDCGWLGSESLNVLSCRQIRHLDVGNCMSVSESNLAHVIHANGRSLSRLFLNCLSAVSDHTLENLARHAPNLQELSLRGCWRVSDRGVFLVGEYNKHLSILHISYCPQVSEVSLAKLRARGVDIDEPAPKQRKIYLQGIHLQV